MITIIIIVIVIILIIIYIYIYMPLHSATGGAVETGCSALHDVMGCSTTYDFPHPLCPPPTAPPFDEYVNKR